MSERMHLEDKASLAFLSDAVKAAWLQANTSGRALWQKVGSPATNSNGDDPIKVPSMGSQMDGWRAVARSNLAVAAVFSIFVNLLMLTLPVYLFQLSDRVLTSHSLDTLLMLSMLAVGFIGVLSLLDILRRQVLARLATKLEAFLGGAILTSIVNSGRAGESGNVHLLRKLQQVRSFISSPVMLLLIDAPLAPLYFGVIFLIHPHLGWITLTSGLALVAIAFLNQRATAAPLALASIHASKADAAADSLARNSQVINAMGMLNEGIFNWGRQQAKSITVQTVALDRNLWISGASKFVRLAAQIIILGWGAHLALDGELTGGMMIAASIIAGRGLQPLEGMIEGWRTFVQTREAYNHVRRAVEAQQLDRPKLLLPKPKGHVSIERVLFIPPGSKEPILNGVGFKLEPGQSIAIVGPSGSGKSTLARVLVGCLTPTAGNVRLDGTELRNWDRRQFGTYVGYLPQEVELFPGNIKQNICRMREDLPDSAIFAAAQIAGVHDMVCQLSHGYETMLERGGAPLSGGQKQRIALARAFFGDPSFVVLDEPNSNLDAAGEQSLTETFERAKQRRVTIAVVTLRPALLNSVDQLLILRGGRVEACGKPSEVLHRLVQAPKPEPIQPRLEQSQRAIKTEAGGAS
jgi:ATP-binding cassette subfamily C protein